ncbi:hypothetical protein OG501_12145 [Streptomyces niveus]
MAVDQSEKVVQFLCRFGALRLARYSRKGLGRPLLGAGRDGTGISQRRWARPSIAPGMRRPSATRSITSMCAKPRRPAMISPTLLGVMPHSAAIRDG